MNKRIYHHVLWDAVIDGEPYRDVIASPDTAWQGKNIAKRESARDCGRFSVAVIELDLDLDDVVSFRTIAAYEAGEAVQL